MSSLGELALKDAHGAETAVPAVDPVVRGPVAGLVLSVAVSNGDRVSEGDALLVLESMKMETTLRAPTDGVVVGVEVREGDSVKTNAVLVTLEVKV